MTKEQLIALGLTEELATTVAKASETELQNFKSLADYNQLDGEKKGLEVQLTAIETKVKALVKDAKGSTLEEQIGEFQTSIETEKGNYETQIKDIKFSHAIEKALAGSKAKNPQIVKAALVLDKLKLNDDGSVTGLDEQLKEIQKSDAYLFGEVNAGGTGSAGNFPRKPLDNDAPGIGERLGKQSVEKTAENPYF